MKQKTFTIAVDFDNTLFTSNGTEILAPIWKTINYCRAVREKGHILILWTCRNGIYLQEAIEACKKVGLEFDYINENTKENLEFYGGIDNRKIWADIYIDDRAMRPQELK